MSVAAAVSAPDGDTMAVTVTELGVGVDLMPPALASRAA